jgi:tellurite resistance protein TerC
MKDDESVRTNNWLVRAARKIYPVTQEFHGARFFVRIDGRWHMTILFLALLVVESTDLIFAVDSIPAVIAVTRDPFLVFTSNIFAILGLRSLYFALSGLVRKFKYLKTALVLLLAFVGAKMLIESLYHIPPLASLLVIVGLITGGVVASLIDLRLNDRGPGDSGSKS